MREDADVIEDSQAAPVRDSYNLAGVKPASCTADCKANPALLQRAAHLRATGKDGLVLDVNNVLICH